MLCADYRCSQQSNASKAGRESKTACRKFVPLVVLVCSNGIFAQCCRTVPCDALIVRMRAAMGATRTAATQCRASCPRTSPLSSSPLPTQPTCLHLSSRASQSQGVPCTSMIPSPCRCLRSPLSHVTWMNASSHKHVNECAHKPKKSACDHVEIERNHFARSVRAQGKSAQERPHPHDQQQHLARALARRTREMRL